MIFDAENRDDGWFRDRTFEVCVVGSGPAGITLSRALAKRGRDVGLFEGGGKDFSSESQELYGGDIVGVNYRPLDLTRLRFFGGSSNHWGGWCRPLDASDFLPHSVNPHSGWPITKSDLDDYAAEADEILDLSPRAPVTDQPDISPLEPISFRFSPPTQFGPKYFDEIARAVRIRMFVNANLVEISLDAARRGVTELHFKSFQREGSFAVRAKFFILCLGGIENPRILLNSQGDNAYAIGNEYGLVGRNFCDHLHFNLGNIFLKESLTGLDFMGPKPEFMDRAGTLNFGLRLVRPDNPQSYLRDIACSTLLTRKLAKQIGQHLKCNTISRLRIASEQALNPESRVRLKDEDDRFGLRRVALDWRHSEVDTQTIRTAAVAAGRVFAARDLARVKLRDWVLDRSMDLPTLREDEVLGNHHMCTTRMSANPRQGVVNASCRVYGVDNLYLGGSSVFATSGHSNPTYTIVQLALRLADHLNDRLG